MSGSPLAPHSATPAELRARLAAEREGDPFLVFRDVSGQQRIVRLSSERGQLSVGRSPECDVALPWDEEVSRLHAELERVGREWVLVDDGLSRNGTFVSEQRLRGRHRLRDGDVIRVGATRLGFRQPSAGAAATTRLSDERRAAVTVTDAQRRVLVALCRPFKHQPTDATPATNPQIAAELYLTVAAVKTHLRALFHSFGLEDFPQQEKRRKLVAKAFATGLVRDKDL